MSRLARAVERSAAVDDQVYRSVFEKSCNAYVLLTTDGIIQEVNAAFVDTFLVSPEDAVGKHLAMLFPDEQTFFQNGVYTGAYQRMWHRANSFFRDPDSDKLVFDTLNLRADGKLINSHVVFQYIDPAGDALILMTVLDVTEDVQRYEHGRYEIYKTITDLAEARDNETGLHLHRIGEYSAGIAEALSLPKVFVEEIRRFAPLHDIGKVAIPDDVLLAPRRLSEEEFAVMKTHTTYGYEILKGKPTLAMAADIAYAHHERYDGTGYPRGLRGGAIPLSARIVAVADVYDALRSERPYKRAWTHDDTIKEMRRGEGSHFCPLVLQAFLDQGSALQTMEYVHD